MLRKTPAFEPRGRLAIDQEVGVRGGAQGGAVAVGMLVDDVRADADVDRDRHVSPHAGRQHALLAIGKLLAAR